MKRSQTDTEAPVVTSFVLTSGTPTANQTIGFTVDAADNKGIAANLVNEDATRPLFTDPGWQTSKPASYTVSAGFGPKTVYAWAKDAANNVSASSSLGVSYEQPWPEPRFTYRRMLTFDNSAQAEDLVNFPVLVALTTSNFTYANAKSNGEDIRFKDAQSGAILDYEIESWNPAGGSFIWVKVPQIDGGPTTDHIYMYYGDPMAVSDEDPAGLWSDYELVYHFSNATTSTVPDSSPNGRDGVSYENITPTAPVLMDSIAGKGIRCDGDYPAAPVLKRYVTTNYGLDLTSWTVEAWIKADAAPKLNAAGGYANGPVMGGTVYNLGWDHYSTVFQGAVQLRDATNGWKAAKLGTLAGGVWYYLSGVYKSSVPEVRAYNNGQWTETQSTLSGTLTSVGATKVCIGVESNRNNPVDGVVDEVRISAVAHSAEWIRAQYLSMTGSFITFGNEITSSELY